MNKFAPVLISTLNRFTHFLRCVDSVAACTHAEKTDLFIALDYPSMETHWDGYNNIQNQLDKIQGFKSVTVIKRDVNLGAEKNPKEAMKTIFKKYDRCILSEDDNEFSPNFLDYMNKGLEKFEDDENVIAVCGHRPIIKIHRGYGFNYYYAKGFSGWGIGMWRGRYKWSIYNINDLNEFINNKVFVNKLKTLHENFYYTVLNSIRTKKTIYGDGAIALDMIKYNKYCVYPSVSKVRNYGHDGSGVHCGYIENSKYSKQVIDTNNEFEYSDNVPLFNKKIAKSLRNYYKINAKQRAKIAIKNLLLKLNIEVRRINNK